MTVRKPAFRPGIVPLDKLAVGDHYHFAFRLIDSPQADAVPAWVVKAIGNEHCRVQLTPSFIVVEKDAPRSIEMTLSKWTMVAPCTIPASAEDRAASHAR